MDTKSRAGKIFHSKSEQLETNGENKYKFICCHDDEYYLKFTQRNKFGTYIVNISIEK